MPYKFVQSEGVITEDTYLSQQIFWINILPLVPFCFAMISLQDITAALKLSLDIVRKGKALVH